MDQNPTQLVEIEPPRGMSPARCDERGRMKLPSVFKEYLDKFPEKRLWVFRGYIEIISERIYEERLAASNLSPKDDVVKLNRAGMGKKEKILVPVPALP